MYSISLLYFGFINTTPKINEILPLFIPDTIVALLNIYFTIATYKKVSHAKWILRYFKMAIINLCFYINVLSACFYIWLYIYKWWNSSENESEFSKSLNEPYWSHFTEIMYLKVPATFHAIAFKLYADRVQKELLDL
jgi:hypothetical protein